MLKVLLIVLLALVAIVIAVVSTGSFLPKAHVVSRRVTLRQSSEAVFSVISNFQESPSWRPDIKQVEMLPSGNGHTRFREQGSNGSIIYEVTESQPPQRLVTEIADKSLPFGGSWTYELARTSEGCRLTITETGEVYNPLFRFVSRFIIGQTRTMDTYMNNLRRKFGETSGS